ncbi:GTPase-activating protein S23 [Nowakowskiella sp. JEL0078]|nr:GTPase-activating protein S23 [Nowakowskiella sp. JEL0078]
MQSSYQHQYQQQYPFPQQQYNPQYQQQNGIQQNNQQQIQLQQVPQQEVHTGSQSFEDIEDRDGIRLSWNVWPNSRVEATRLIVPIGTLYTPLKEREGQISFDYEPVWCKAPCRAVLNPYCQIDARSKIWVCPFCLQRNPFPPLYNDISQQNLPAELLSTFTTIEYILKRPFSIPPIFLYVVDTCLEEDELKSLKESLMVSLSLLPSTSLVGLITFGTMAQLHELGYSNCPKSYVFRGSKEYSAKQIHDMLGFAIKSGQSMRPGQPAADVSRFILPVSECEFTLTSILEQLQRDPWPVDNDKRSLRSTGVALSVAVGILETAFPNSGARIVLFAGGPCTEGPGIVVGPELRESIRSYNDLDKDLAKYVKKAIKFYESLAKRAAEMGHIIDIFAGCLDQVGLMEMKSLAATTNGVIVISDSFTTSMFKQSFLRLFVKDEQNNLLMGFNASFDVQVSRELKVCGLIGLVTSMSKKGPSVGETEIGISGTTSWKICGISPKTTVGVYFEVASHQPLAPNSRGLIQFTTKYQHSNGTCRLRVTTVARTFQDVNSPEIAASFDQEAAAVLMARIATFKADIDDGPDVLRWLDRMLIRLCQKYADYRRDDPSSFQLSNNFSIYPQFMFHLRRSQYLQVFNNSPDEVAFYRLT